MPGRINSLVLVFYGIFSMFFWACAKLARLQLVQKRLRPETIGRRSWKANLHQVAAAGLLSYIHADRGKNEGREGLTSRYT